MIEMEDVTEPGFRFLSGDSENICSLCFGGTENTGVYLTESRLIECHYYVNTVTFEEMLVDLGISIDFLLPQILCEGCADAAMNSFLFLKLYHHSQSKWLETMEKFNKTLDLCNTLGPTVKTAFLIMQNEGNHIVTCRKQLTLTNGGKTKTVALMKLRDLARARQTYAMEKKKGVQRNKACEECGELFPSKNLAQHTLSHNTKYPCKLCPKIFVTKIRMLNHIKNVHKPKIFQCPKCAKMFSSESLLQSHDSEFHTPATCKHCLIELPSKKDLREHTFKHMKSIKCRKCNEEFSKKYAYKKHLLCCGKEEYMQSGFICDICKKEYASKNGLRSHLRIDHGFGHFYICSWCKKPFDAASKLRNHIVKHTKERNFYCDQCGGQFVTQPALVYHMRLHTGEKPFPCDMCDESFLNASRRMEHKRRKHLGPNRECTICHNMFVTGHELRKHLERHKNPHSRLFRSENGGEIKSRRPKKYFYV